MKRDLAIALLLDDGNIKYYIADCSNNILHPVGSGLGVRQMGYHSILLYTDEEFLDKVFQRNWCRHIVHYQEFLKAIGIDAPKALLVHFSRLMEIQHKSDNPDLFDKMWNHYAVHSPNDKEEIMCNIVTVCLQWNGDLEYWDVDCSAMKVRFNSRVEFISTPKYQTDCDLLLYAGKDPVDFDKASKAFSHVVDYNEFRDSINSSGPWESILEFEDMMIWNYLNVGSSVYDNVYRLYGSKETAKQEATNKYPVSNKFTGFTPLTTKEK